MNDTSTSNLMETRWDEAVKNYVPRMSTKWKKLVSLQEGIWNSGVNALRTGPSRTSSAKISRFHDDMRRLPHHVSKSIPRRGHHVHLERQLPLEWGRLTDLDKEKRPVSCEARRLARDAISGAVKVSINLGRDIGFGKP